MSNLIDRLWSGSRDLPMGSDLLTEAATAIATLEQQVEKLTKERDIKEHCITQFELEDLRMKEQLAALAEQNEKMREALTKARFDSLNMTLTDWDILKSVANLPDLSTPNLNKYRAEGMRVAINIYSPDDSAQDWIDKIRARAGELENSK